MDLELTVDKKISNNIHDIQQILEGLTGEELGYDVGFVQNNNILQKETIKEKKQPTNNNMTNTNIEEDKNTNIADYKIKTDWYASLLMYNSY